MKTKEQMLFCMTTNDMQINTIRIEYGGLYLGNDHK